MAQAEEHVGRGALLPLAVQNAFRERYRAIRPGWRSSGDQLETIVRSHVTGSSSVLDLGCGRGGVVELFWRDVKLAAGLDPPQPSPPGRRPPGLPGVTRRGGGPPVPRGYVRPRRGSLGVGDFGPPQARVRRGARGGL